MNKSTVLIGAIAVVASLAGGWFFASPFLTLSSMKSAAERADGSALERYIDFEAVRSDLKAELAASMQQKASDDTSGMGQLGMALGMAMIGPMIDSMVTPQGMQALLTKGAAERGGPEISPMKSILPIADFSNLKIARDGLDRFILTADGHQDGPEFVFERRGLSWKLIGVDNLPASN
jgi:Protein of unknown function (DUF2939)